MHTGWQPSVSANGLQRCDVTDSSFLRTSCRATTAARAAALCHASAEGPHAQPLRIWAASDIHCDYADNLEWVQSLTQRNFGASDVLLLAGDATEDIGILRQTLTCLRETFGKVFFVPGNHELWLRGGPDDPRNCGARDSYEKLQLIFQLCTELGVATRPQRLGNLWVVPLQSWHHRSFDREPEAAGLPGASMMACTDYAACVWPDWIPDGNTAGSLGLAAWMDSLNEGIWDEAQRGGCDVISMSHFLPHQELLPEKRFLYAPYLAKVAGSDPLAARVAALRPDVHVFGHTHFGWSISMHGTRYIQAALGYPSERRRRLPSLAIRDVSNAAAPPEVDAEAADAPPDWLPALIYTANSGVEADDGARNGSSAGSASPQQPGASRLDAGASLPRARHDAVVQLRHGRVCAERLQASWSEYYKANPRDPDNVELAPWVLRRQQRRRSRVAKEPTA